MYRQLQSLFLVIPFLLIVFGTQAQDSLNMTKLSNWQSAQATKYNDCWGYADSAREYAILGSNWGTHFVDVTNPATPQLVQEFAGKFTNVIWRDFKTYQHYAYGVADGATNSLQIFDLQYLPDSVVKVYDEDSLSSSAHNCFVEGDRLYLPSNRRNNVFHTLDVFSLSNPEVPVFIGTLNNMGLFNETHDVFVRGDTAWCSGGASGSTGGGLFVYDFSNPANATLITSITSYPEKGYNHASWLSEDGKTLVMADETHGSGLKLFDVTDLQNIQLLSVLRSHPGALAHNPYIRGDSIYVSYYHDGSYVFSLSNPMQPPVVSFYDTYPQNPAGQYNGFEGNWGIYPFLPSRNIVSSDISTGLYMLQMQPLIAAPDAAIKVLQQKGCMSYSVILENDSKNEYSVSWDFGDPSSTNNTSSSLQTVQHTYTVAGTYVVTLIAQNPIGSDTAFYTVQYDGSPTVAAPYFEDFDNGPTIFCLDSNSNSTVRVGPVSGGAGNSLNFRVRSNGPFNASPTCNLSFVNNLRNISSANFWVKTNGGAPVIDFRVTFNGTSTPLAGIGLRVLGDTARLLCLQPATLPFSDHVTIDLGNLPQPLPDSIFISMQGLLRFGSQTISLDSIRITQAVTALNEDNQKTNRISIYPNPSKGSFSVLTEDLHPEAIEVYDLTGRKVGISVKTNTLGVITVQLIQAKAGAYLLRYVGQDFYLTEKLIVTD